MKGLGPAFYTKLLHFAASVEHCRQLRHLILDKKVAEAIGWLDKPRCTPEEYRDYLNLINEVHALVTETERADCVEKQLFALQRNGNKPLSPISSVASQRRMVPIAGIGHGYEPLPASHRKADA
ncbi:8-oxoguanine DNA glycosylase OGG fold protein [Glutamicibacter ardleyensis]|uniref:8-oxoguanine DNA glycosylase OGG fold protein n=1 Tax=Glutamicibacter ardleyensis TaxID=225894 RepID=UPI003FD062CC